MNFNELKLVIDTGLTRDGSKVKILCYEEENNPVRLCFVSKYAGNIATDFLLNNLKMTWEESVFFRKQIEETDWLIDKVLGVEDQPFRKDMRVNYDASKRRDH